MPRLARPTFADASIGEAGVAEAPTRPTQGIHRPPRDEPRPGSRPRRRNPPAKPREPIPEEPANPRAPPTAPDLMAGARMAIEGARMAGARITAPPRNPPPPPPPRYPPPPPPTCPPPACPPPPPCPTTAPVSAATSSEDGDHSHSQTPARRSRPESRRCGDAWRPSPRFRWNLLIDVSPANDGPRPGRTLAPPPATI